MSKSLGGEVRRRVVPRRHIFVKPVDGRIHGKASGTVEGTGYIFWEACAGLEYTWRAQRRQVSLGATMVARPPSSPKGERAFLVVRRSGLFFGPATIY